jgi:RNA polymerase sigma-70 factor, ECF subfamily
VPENAWQQQYLRLLDTHGDSLMAMLRRLSRNSHDAEDVFQETAVRVWRAWPNRPMLRNPRAWIMTIGYRSFLDFQARRRKHEPLVDAVDKQQNNPRQIAETSEEKCRVQGMIANLPDAIREVVVLHYVGGLSLSQTARAMEVPLSTVKSRLHTAIDSLRSILE